jgi:hypothetical protein
MRTTLTTIAETAGADVVIYDRDQLANVLIDMERYDTVICLLDILRFETRTSDNGLDYSFTAQIKFGKQVGVDSLATENEPTFTALQTICFRFVLGLVNSRLYQRNINVVWEKHHEAMDFNLSGYRATITLTPIHGYTEC